MSRFVLPLILIVAFLCACQPANPPASIPTITTPIPTIAPPTPSPSPAPPPPTRQSDISYATQGPIIELAPDWKIQLITEPEPKMEYSGHRVYYLILVDPDCQCRHDYWLVADIDDDGPEYDLSVVLVSDELGPGADFSLTTFDDLVLPFKQLELQLEPVIPTPTPYSML